MEFRKILKDAEDQGILVVGRKVENMITITSLQYNNKNMMHVNYMLAIINSDIIVKTVVKTLNPLN